MAATRTQDVFEHIDGYELADVAPLPDVDDYAGLARHGMLRLTPTSKAIVRGALKLVGYPAFHEKLSQNIEHILRKTNVRVERIFGPAYSATVVMREDPRRLRGLDQATTLVLAAREFCDDVMRGRLSQDRVKGRPIEMGQFPNLFCTHYVLESGRWVLRKSTNFDQITIIVRRKVYVLQLPAQGMRSAAVVRAELQAIVDDAGTRDLEDGESVCVVTACQGKTSKRLLQRLQRGNADALAAVSSSLLVLCLDLDREPATDADVGHLTQAANPANRWYFSSFQIVVFGNGRAANIFSFSAYVDGNVMMRGSAELHRRAAKVSLPEALGSASSPRRLTWDLRGVELRQAWAEARSVQNDERSTFELEHCGRRLFDAAGVDPVGCFVIALAIATARAGSRIPPITQLMTISKFRCGSLGIADLFTREMRALVDAWDSASREERQHLITEALASQARETKAERKSMSLRFTIDAFLRTRTGAPRVASRVVLLTTGVLLMLTGALQRERIVLSHPEIFPELAYLGRPGVRVPYISHFGFHYQLFPDRTVFTVMPGKMWKVTNAAFASLIDRASAEVIAAVQNGAQDRQIA